MKNTVNNECRKNDRLDDKTMWELMPLDCLEDIARVYTEGAKKYGPNKWQGLENGYERYKGALLRHLYASESKEFDEETGCRHLAQVAWNAIAMLWLSKHKPNTDNTDKINTYKDFVDIVLGEEKQDNNYNTDIGCYKINVNKCTGDINYKYIITNGKLLAWTTSNILNNIGTEELYKLTINNENHYYLINGNLIDDKRNFDKLTKEQAKSVLKRMVEGSKNIVNYFENIKID